MRSIRGKGWTTWLLALALMLALAGCSGTSQGGEGDAARTETQAGEQGEGSAQNEAARSADDEPLELSILAGLYSEMPDMGNEFWTELQQQLNVKLDIEFIPSGDFFTKMDLVLASGDLPEVIASPSETHVPLLNAIRNGAFWDLKPFLGDMSDYPNLKNNLAPNALKYLTVDGGIYALPRSRTIIDLSLPIRKDWLDRLDIPVPTTIDEYHAALKQIVESDLDGNGRHDTFGLIGHGFILDDGDLTLASAFGAGEPVFNDEGGMISHQLTPQYTDMIAWLRELYADGILPKEFYAMKKTQAEELMQTGRAASYVRSTYHHWTWEQSLKKTDPNAEIMALPPLKGPGGYSVELAKGVSGGFYISKKVPEEKVWKIIDYFERTASEEITELAYNGIEGIHYNMEDGVQVMTDKGQQQINTTSLGATVLAYSKWGKVIRPGSPPEYNERKQQEVKDYEQYGYVNPFYGIISDTWLDIWPNHQSDWETQVIQAIVGDISMEQYEAYVADLNNRPEFRQAYQEFAADYEQFWSE